MMEGGIQFKETEIKMVNKGRSHWRTRMEDRPCDQKASYADIKKAIEVRQTWADMVYKGEKET